MRHTKTYIGTLSAAAIALACIATVHAAGPTTTRPATSQPTSRPAVPALTPANSVEVKSEKFGLHFRVLKAWQKRDGTATEGGEIFIYGPPTETRVVGGPPIDRHVSVLLGNTTDPATSIDDLAAHMRDKVTETVGHAVKFTKDVSAGEVAGEPAWRLEFPTEQTVHVTTKVNGVDKGEHDVKLMTSERLVFWQHNGAIAQLQYSCDASSAVGMDRIIQQMLNSMGYGE